MSDLDEALRELYPQAPEDSASLRRARARVLARTGRRTPRMLAVAAALLTAVVVVVVLTQRRVPMVEVAQTLTTAADAQSQNPDEPVPAGRYRYIATHSLDMSYGSSASYRWGRLIETWVPSDPGGVWVERRTDTGERLYLVGTPSPGGDSYPAEVRRGRCGDFFPQAGVDPCDRAGSWQEPTPAFVAGLPRDPRRLYDRLRGDAAGHGRDAGQEVLVYAADALRSGLLPADLRAALYRALALLPELTITERATTLDGRAGTALGIVAAGERREIVIEPVTGAFVGERTVLTASRDGIPAGTTVKSSSVEYRVVRTVG